MAHHFMARSNWCWRESNCWEFQWTRSDLPSIYEFGGTDLFGKLLVVELASSFSNLILLVKCFIDFALFQGVLRHEFKVCFKSLCSQLLKWTWDLRCWYFRKDRWDSLLLWCQILAPKLLDILFDLDSENSYLIPFKVGLWTFQYFLFFTWARL